MKLPANPRAEIESILARGDLESLLHKAGELHGHFCPYLALGVRAGYIAMRELGAKGSGMEEVIAIVETNSCFSDGVQIVTGCTFGNNALVFRDVGKTAFTLAKRDGQSVRVAVKPDYQERFASRFPEAEALFDKLVGRREEPGPGENERMMQLWAEASFVQLQEPAEELFKVERKVTLVPPYAPIFASSTCSLCGESVMEPRVRVKDGQPVCMDCVQAEQYILDGKGMSLSTWR